MSQASEKRLWIVTVYLTLPTHDTEEARAFLINTIAPLLSHAAGDSTNGSQIQLRGAQFGNATQAGMPVSTFVLIESAMSLAGPAPAWLEDIFARLPGPARVQGISAVSPVLGA